DVEPIWATPNFWIIRDFLPPVLEHFGKTSLRIFVRQIQDEHHSVWHEAAFGPSRLRAVRALIEPAEMPPRDGVGYGIVAFTTRPLSHDIERYQAICEAYKATLISVRELPANTPPSEQMVTYWPITNKNTP